MEPLYGDRYLPRKFKIGITVPGDNAVDIYTNDIGLVVITNDAGELEGPFLSSVCPVCGDRASQQPGRAWATNQSVPFLFTPID